MHAAGEQQLDLAGVDLARRQFRQQLVDHRAPQHEAAERADVAAALAALEDEAPRAFAQGLIRALFQIRFNADGDYHHWRFSHLRLIHGRPS